MHEPSSRRAVLKSGAGGIAAALSTVLAGCQSFGDSGSDGNETTVTLPDVAGPWYRPWIPSPEAGATVVDPVRYADFDRLRSVEDRVSTSLKRGVRSIGMQNRDHLDISLDVVSRVVRFGPSGVVLLGSFTADQVGEALVNSGYNQAGPKAGYEFFERTDAPRAAAVTDNRVIWVSDRDPVQAVRSVVAAKRGNGPRLGDSRPLFTEMCDAVGAGLHGRVLVFPTPTRLAPPQSESAESPDQSPKANAIAHTFAIEDAHLYRHVEIRYVDGEKQTDAHEQFISTDTYDTVDVSIDWPAVSIAARRPLGSFEPVETNNSGSMLPGDSLVQPQPLRWR